MSFWLCGSIGLFDCVFGWYVVRLRLVAFSPSIGSCLVAGIRFHIRLCLLVTTLRVHPAVTRLTVYRRPYVFGVFNREYLEMCKFVSQTWIFLKVSRVKAFDWWSQIAKQICNEGAVPAQGPVP